MINVQRIEPVISNRKYVTWVLNNICPYSCVYCPEIVHSGKIKTYYDWEVHKEFLDFLFDYWKGNKITFAITGGEPTVHPYFEKILDKINEAGHDVGITTNLSRSINFWESIIDKLNYVSTSFHPHYENTDIKHKKFIDKLLVLSEKTKYEVRVMMYPELWDTCIDFIDKVRETNYNWTDGAIDQVMTVKVLEDFGILDKYCDINYTDEQLDYIDNFDFASEDIIINHKIQERNKQLYSVQEQVYLIDIENKKYIPNHIQEISNKRLTNFSGWNCNIGIDSIYIDYDGVIKGGNCLEGGIIGDLLSKVNWNVEPIRCGSTYCHCVTDIKITKEFEEDANEVLLSNDFFSSYDGEYKDGLRHGVGTHYYTSGDKYLGEWEHGVQTGKGVFTYSDGSTHRGYYKGGVYNGSGRFTRPNGTKYKGNFLEGEFHGKGVLTLPDGTIYDGLWKNGQMNGLGKLFLSNGIVYEGEFIGGVENGKGKSVLPNGETYIGEWENGKKHGKGFIKYENGAQYEGDWVNSFQHGYGILTIENKTKIYGIFKEGNLKKEIEESVYNKKK